MLERKRS